MRKKIILFLFLLFLFLDNRNAFSYEESDEVTIKGLDLSGKTITEGQQSSKISSVKSNMHTFQTILETYSVDWAGVYPKTSKELKKVATSSNYPYWKDFKNPFTRTARNSFVDFSIYIKQKNKSKYKGYVIYEAILKSTPITSYKIYGTDENGEIIKDSTGNVLYLTNN